MLSPLLLFQFWFDISLPVISLLILLSCIYFVMFSVINLFCIGIEPLLSVKTWTFKTPFAYSKTSHLALYLKGAIPTAWPINYEDVYLEVKGSRRTIAADNERWAARGTLRCGKAFRIVWVDPTPAVLSFLPLSWFRSKPPFRKLYPT